jgi:hypothetical protein
MMRTKRAGRILLITGILATAWCASEPTRRLTAADSRPGYLHQRGSSLGKLRVQPPAKPPVPSLPPLPQTYIPEPQHTAEFIAQLHATSAQFQTNFTVKAETPDPVDLGSTLPPGGTPSLTTGGVTQLDAAGQTDAILGFFTRGASNTVVPVSPGTDGVNPLNPFVPIVLPLNGLLQPQLPATGTGKATYELR